MHAKITAKAKEQEIQMKNEAVDRLKGSMNDEFLEELCLINHLKREGV